MKKENNQEFIELIKNLNQKDIGRLIDYAIELKREEIQGTIDY